MNDNEQIPVECGTTIASLFLGFLITCLTCGIAFTLAAKDARPREDLPTLERWGMPTADYDTPVKGQWAHSWNGMARCPRWSIEIMTSDSLRHGHGVERKDRWHIDKNIPDEFRSTGSDYDRQPGIDKGHCIPSANHLLTQPDNDATDVFSNVFPEASQQNRQCWEHGETAERNLVRLGKDGKPVTLWRIVAPLWIPDEDCNVTARCIGPNKVWVPTHVGLTTLAMSNNEIELKAYIVPNTDEVAKRSIEEFRVSVDDLERASGLDFWRGIEDVLEKELESERPAK